MKQKINLRLALVALVALVLTTLGITRVYYDLFQHQVRKDLRINAQMLSAPQVFAQGEQALKRSVLPVQKLHDPLSGVREIVLRRR